MGNAQARYKADGYTFSLFDDSIIDRLVEHGLDKGVGVDFPPGYCLVDNLLKEIQAALEHGSKEVFVADSLEDPGRADRRGCREY